MKQILLSFLFLSAAACSSPQEEEEVDYENIVMNEKEIEGKR